METNKPAPLPASPSPPAKGSQLRLIILLGLLVVVLGALAYDFLVLKPSWDKAYADIQALVDSRNKQGVKDAQLVTSADIQKEIGRAPTWVYNNDEEGYTVEHYCWWGKVPLLSRRRRFIAVVYTGNQPRHFSSHYQEEPPEEALPIMQEPPKETSGQLDAPSDGGGAKSEDAPGTSDKVEPAKAPESAEKSADSAKADKTDEKAKDNP
jgi:hypothetical protein